MEGVVGRPTTYNEEIASLICARMADGESLRSICRDDAMPALSTVFLWVSKHSEFSEQYKKDKIYDKMMRCLQKQNSMDRQMRKIAIKRIKEAKQNGEDDTLKQARNT